MQAQAKGRVQTTHFNTGNNDQPGPSTQQRNSSLNWGYLSKVGTGYVRAIRVPFQTSKVSLSDKKPIQSLTGSKNHKNQKLILSKGHEKGL